MRVRRRYTVFLTLGLAVVFGLSAGVSSALARKKLSIAYMSHPIHLNSVKWMKKWAQENDVELVEHPMSYEVYMQKITNAFKAKSDEYDLIWHNDDWGQLWCNYLASVEGVKSKKLIDRFLLDDIFVCNVDGKMVDTAIPFVITGPLVYYRKDLIKPEEIPKTWQEFQELSMRLQKEGKVKYGYVGGMKYPHTWFSLLWAMWANNCDILQPRYSRNNKVLAAHKWTTLMDHPCMQETMEFWWDNIHKYKIVPPDMPGYTRNEANAIFMAGNAAMTVADNVFYGTLNDPKKSKVAGKLGFAGYPKGPQEPGERAGAFYASWAWAIPKFISKERQELAKQLLDWLTASEEVQVDMWKSQGGQVVNMKVHEKLMQTDPVYREMASVLMVEKLYPPAYYFKAWPKMHSMYSSYAIKAVLAKDRKAIPGILKQAARDIHRALCRPPDCIP